MEEGEKEMGRFLLLTSGNGNVKEMDMGEIWDYKPSSNPSPSYDKSDITKNKELVDVYADKYANELRIEV